MAKKKSTAAGKDTACPSGASSQPAVPEEPDLPNPPAFAWEDKGPVSDPPPDRRVEPAWAARVREAAPNSTATGPPPASLGEANLGAIQFDAPFVELTLVETGRYTGPTRGRVCRKEESGFDFLTHQGAYYVPWDNLAFWRYLPET